MLYKPSDLRCFPNADRQRRTAPSGAGVGRVLQGARKDEFAGRGVRRGRPGACANLSFSFTLALSLSLPPSLALSLSRALSLWCLSRSLSAYTSSLCLWCRVWGVGARKDDAEGRGVRCGRTGAVSLSLSRPERLTRGTVTTTMRRAAHPSGCARCGAGAGCSAITYQSL